MDIVSSLGQMVSSSPPLLAALFLGVMASISPCPLGSNLAATAMIARSAASKAAGLVSCVAYAMGRIAAYLLICAVLWVLGRDALGLLSPLQQYSDLLLSAILIISGLALVGKLPLGFSFDTSKLSPLLKSGMIGAFGLGFALSFVFCPVSAAIFMGGVIPLIFSTSDFVGIPLAYGVGTAFTVLVLAAPLILAKEGGKKMLNLPTNLIKQAEIGLGIIFILAGLFYLLVFLKLA